MSENKKNDEDTDDRSPVTEEFPERSKPFEEKLLSKDYLKLKTGLLETDQDQKLKLDNMFRHVQSRTGQSGAGLRFPPMPPRAAFDLFNVKERPGDLEPSSDNIAESEGNISNGVGQASMAANVHAAWAALQAGQTSLNQLYVQLMAIGAQSPGMWQSQLAAIAAKQGSSGNNSSLPTANSLSTSQFPPNELRELQQALQLQQQNIQNLLLLQQAAPLATSKPDTGQSVPSPSLPQILSPPAPFLGLNQVKLL